jgi:hypothetical protein
VTLVPVYSIKHFRLSFQAILVSLLMGSIAKGHHLEVKFDFIKPMQVCKCIAEILKRILARDEIVSVDYITYPSIPQPEVHLDCSLDNRRTLDYSPPNFSCIFSLLISKEGTGQALQQCISSISFQQECYVNNNRF